MIPYNTKVRILEGFYTGYIGRVTDYKEHKGQYLYDVILIHKEKVLNGKIVHNLKEDELKKMMFQI